MSANILNLKGAKSAPESTPKTDKSSMETVLITPETVESWKHPPFQRPLKVNERVLALVEELKKDTGIIPGIVTIGVLNREKYLIDGQHRIEAFKMTGLPEGLADIRLKHFEDMAQMGEEFVKLNSSLVRMGPNDILRGMEGVYPALALIRKHCKFVGYSHERVGNSRNENAVLVTMAQAVRAWRGGAVEVPSSAVGSAIELAKDLTADEAEEMIKFFTSCRTAWGNDVEYYRAWSGLNLTISAWLYHKVVLQQYSQQSVRVTRAQFEKFLNGITANANYMEWLVGRQLSERDRSPCYARLRAIFVERLANEFPNKKLRLPSPSWSAHS